MAITPLADRDFEYGRKGDRKKGSVGERQTLCRGQRAGRVWESQSDHLGIRLTASRQQSAGFADPHAPGPSNEAEPVNGEEKLPQTGPFSDPIHVLEPLALRRAVTTGSSFAPQGHSPVSGTGRTVRRHWQDRKKPPGCFPVKTFLQRYLYLSVDLWLVPCFPRNLLTSRFTREIGS